MHEIKEMDLGGVFGTSFKLVFTKNLFKLSLFILIVSIILTIAISIVIAAVILILMATNLIDINTLSEFDFSNPVLVIILYAAIYVILIIYSVILLTFMFGTLIDLFSKTFLDKEWKIKGCVKRVLKKFFRLLFFYILYGLMLIIVTAFVVIPMILLAAGSESGNIALIIISSLLLILFGIISLFVFLILNNFFMLTAPIIINEDKSLFQSISRSLKLVKPNFWGILGTSALFYLMIYFLLYVIQFVVALIIIIVFFVIALIFSGGNLDSFFSDSANSAIMVAFIIVLYAVMYPLMFFISFLFYCLFSSFQTTIYFNQKIRVEGFGIQLLAESMINEEKNKLENVQES